MLQLCNFLLPPNSQTSSSKINPHEKSQNVLTLPNRFFSKILTPLPFLVGSSCHEVLYSGGKAAWFFDKFMI